ncbi:MAG: VWA domain-containing protein, partial [Planctomycetes bacterium]|nr:VWA domain-containing protein [Planctomycetota bacterium]
MKKYLYKLILLIGFVSFGLWLPGGSGLALRLRSGQAQSLNNQVKIMQVNPAPGMPNMNEVYVSVTGPYPNHFSIPNLTGDAFAVYEDDNDTPVTINDDLTTKQVGLAVVILIDRSGSMREGGVEKPNLRIDSARQAALELVDHLDPSIDLVSIIGFHDEIGPQLAFTP